MSLLQIGLFGLGVYMIWFVVSVSITLVKKEDFSEVLYRTPLVSAVLFVSKVMIVELVISIVVCLVSVIWGI